MKLVRLNKGAHPTPSKKGIEQDLRTMSFEDWMLMIIRANVHNLPKEMQKQYEIKR